jgi:excisionase family DNA binding protein
VTGRLEAAFIELAAAIRAELAEASSPTPDRLLSIPEAAQALSVGRTTLYAELDAGRLRSVKVGHRGSVTITTLR